MLTLTNKQLATICAGFNKIVARNSAIPVLRYVLLHPGGLLATNLEETLEYQLAGPETSFLVAYEDLKRLGKGLSKSGTVTLSLGEGCVEAVIDDAQPMTQSLDTLSLDEFPVDNPDGDFTDLDITSFLAGFQQAARAASKDVTRLALNGVHLDPAGACFVGTDGHRLMRMPCEVTLSRGVTIPTTRLLASSVLSGEARIALTGNQALLHAGPWLYSCKLIDAAFPKYESVIPGRDNTTRIDLGADLDAKALTRAIRQFPDTGRALYLYADTDGAAILADDTGSGFVAIDLPGASAPVEAPIIMAFDRRYFIDAILADFRTLAVADSYKPISFYRDAACYILMPLRDNSNDDYSYDLETSEGYHSLYNDDPIWN